MEPERSSPAVAVPDAKATLNGILKNVVQHLLDGVPHANFFRNPVSCVVVDDYRDYVPPGQDMCLGKILERTESQYYSDVAAFRADLQLMYDNAAAYNGRNGGKHAYEPVIHWAANMLAAAYKELCHSMPLEAPNTGEQKPPCHTTAQLGVPTVEAAWDPATAPSAPSADAADATERPSGGSIPPRLSPIDQCNDIKPSPLRPASQEHLLAKSQQPQQPDQQPQADQRTLDPIQEQQQQHAQQRISVAGNGQGSPRAANGSSAGQQSSSPSSGSGAGSHSGLEALLAACELAAEQDSAAPRGDAGVAAAAAAAAAVCVGVGAGDAPPERRSFPGCSGQSKQSEQPEQQQQQAEEDDEEHQQQELALVAFEPAHDGCAGPGLMSAGKSQQQREDPAGSSEGGGMELCCLPSGGGSGGGPEGTATMAQAGGSGGGGREMVVTGGGGSGAGGSYLASNAFKNRRHKSKVYIKPNKVVYLPTTFVEEEFDVSALPLDCELRVEADGALTDETFRVTIKAVPRQGLSTMYCMTNVMRFQQQYLNWQIYNWTRIDNTHIKIHLQSPSPSQTHLQRPDLDRSASMPEVGRNFAFRASEDGAFGYQARGAGGAVAASSLKRKSDTGRYNVTRVERRLAPEPGREMLPLELRLSSTGYAQYPSPIPESPPASPQRRMSACPASTAAVVSMGAALPPRAPANHGAIPTRLSGAQQFSLQPQQSHHHQQQQIHQQQIQIHHHHHYTGGHFQNQPIQSLYHQQHSHSHSHPHPPHSGSGVSANNPLSLPFSIGQIQQPQVQRGSNSSILTKQDQQTCSEDSSGPVGADVAPGGGQMQLAWHPSAPAGGGSSGTRSARFSGGAATARTAAVLQPLDVHDLAEQLQVQAKATGGELSALGALQLAIVALQQQQQHSLLMAALPRGSADGAGGGGGGIAPLDLANAVDQERLLQQLAIGALAHPHARAPRWSTGRLDSIDGAPDMEFGGQRGPSSAGALDAYTHQQQPTASSHLYHDEQQQHRRSSQGERSRQGVAAPQGCKQAGHQQQQHGNEDNLTATTDGVPDAVARVAAGHAVEQQLGGVTMEIEGQQHPPRYARHSVTGTGLHVVSGGAGAANKMFPANIGSLVSTGGRIRFDVGPAPSGAVTAMGPRASASGRRLPGGGGAASIVSDFTDHLAQAAGVSLAAAAAFPGGLDLPDCNAADIISLLSPTKRYKVAVSTDSTAAAVGGGGGQELPVLDMLSGLRAAAAAAAAAGARSLQTEAALTALRLGGGGQQAANALNGRSFLPVGPEILGQLM